MSCSSVEAAAADRINIVEKRVVKVPPPSCVLARFRRKFTSGACRIRGYYDFVDLTLAKELVAVAAIRKAARS
jgi:hypothetical protein